MSSSLDSRALRALPKVELHRHLDGSIRPETIAALVRYHRLDVGKGSPEEITQRALVTAPKKDLAAVLASFWILQRVLASYDAIKRVAFENVEDAFRDGVKLLELRFAPCFIAQEKEIGFDEIIEGVIDGVTKGMEAYRIQVGLIGIAARAFGAEANRPALSELIRYRRSIHRNADRICGFDLADSEENTDAASFVQLVEEARSAGMGITVHTGESSSAEHLKRAVALYAPERIGHGIKAWGDEEAIELLKRRGILLELCPTSNWLTRSVASLAEHPIGRLRDAGVEVCINSDDPQLMGIDLVNEYRVCVESHGFGLAELDAANSSALEKSFLDREAKQDTLKLLRER